MDGGFQSMLMTLATSPQSNSRLLLRGLKLYAASIKQVIGLALLFSFIVYIPQVIAIYSGLNVFGLARSLAFYNLFFFIVNFCALFVFTAMLWRMNCVMLNQHESILDDFIVASKKILLIAGASIISMLLISFLVYIFVMLPAQNIVQAPSTVAINLGLIFLVLGFFISIYIIYLLIFYLPLILTENKGIMAALKKSFRLVRGHWWKVFLLLVTPYVVYWIFLWILQGVLHIDMSMNVAWNNAHKALWVMFNVLFFALFVPFEGALLLLQLRDLEIRKQV